MTSELPFSKLGAHRVAVVATSPELVRIKYIDSKPVLTQSEQQGTILLLHGFPQTSYQFRHVIQPLTEAGYRVIAADSRGCGGSSKPHDPASYSKVQMATDMHTLLHSPDCLGITDFVHIVGHDIGGMIAAAYAFTFPSDCASVIWGECPLPGSNEYAESKGTDKLFHFQFHKIPDLPEKLISGNEEQYLSHFFNKLLYNMSGIAGADLSYYVREYAQPGGVRGGINAYRTFEEDAEDNLKALQEHGKCKVRCLILSGKHSDHALHATEAGDQFFENHVRAEIEESAHYIAEENPAAFVREVLSFVKLPVQEKT